MKKITTGVIAVGAGIALLAGSAGSIAYWQSQQTTGAVAFTTGGIDLTQKEERWYLNGSEIEAEDGGLTARERLAGLRLVPGSTLVWEYDFFAERIGNDLYLELDVELGGLSVQPAGETPAPEQPFTISYTLPSSAFEAVSGSPNTWKMIGGSGDYTLRVTLEWPLGNTADTSGQLEERTIDFAASTFTLRQVAAPTPTPPVG